VKQISRGLFPRVRRVLERDLGFPPPEQVSVGDRYERVIPITVCRDVGNGPPIKVQLVDVFNGGYGR
jgi:hypothetical protein